jgi:serine/threonine-protein kinase
MRSGDTVLLVISQGPPPVEVPNLTGLTPGQAEDILDDLGLELQVSGTTQPVADPGQDGVVVSQVPSVGATVFPGDIVRVTLGEFTPPPTTTTTSTTTTTTTPTTTTAP